MVKLHNRSKVHAKVDKRVVLPTLLNSLLSLTLFFLLVGSVEGYGYSGALVAVAETWSPENLDGFLENPKKYAPGTKMGFAGLKKPVDRANLIAYLATIK